MANVNKQENNEPKPNLYNQRKSWHTADVMPTDNPDHADRVEHRRQRVEDRRETATGQGLEVPFQRRQEFRVVFRFYRQFLQLAVARTVADDRVRVDLLESE